MKPAIPTDPKDTTVFVISVINIDSTDPAVKSRMPVMRMSKIVVELNDPAGYCRK